MTSYPVLMNGASPLLLLGCVRSADLLWIGSADHIYGSAALTIYGSRPFSTVPARPNVYAHENLRAAQTLVDADWPTLALYLHPAMVHAKATLARGPDGGAVRH